MWGVIVVFIFLQFLMAALTIVLVAAAFFQLSNRPLADSAE